jgi:hypothetical protein
MTFHSKISRGEETLPFEALKVGDQVGGSLSTTGIPTPDSAFDIVYIWCPGGKSVPVPGGDNPRVGPGAPGTPAPGTKPDGPDHAFGGGFFRWNRTLRGEILGTDVVDGKNVINLDVLRFFAIPKGLRDEGREVVSLDSLVVVGPKLVITDADGKRIAFSDLKVDDKLEPKGRFQKEAKWLVDESGEPTPTLTAKRTCVLS